MLLLLTVVANRVVIGEVGVMQIGARLNKVSVFVDLPGPGGRHRHDCGNQLIDGVVDFGMLCSGSGAQVETKKDFDFDFG